MAVDEYASMTVDHSTGPDGWEPAEISDDASTHLMVDPAVAASEPHQGIGLAPPSGGAVADTIQ
jgi:hypothetical protein